MFPVSHASPPLHFPAHAGDLSLIDIVLIFAPLVKEADLKSGRGGLGRAKDTHLILRKALGVFGHIWEELVSN